MTLREIQQAWGLGLKAYDKSWPHMVPLDTLWDIRDWTRTREHCVGCWQDQPDGDRVLVSGTEVWDQLEASLAMLGWDPKRPALVSVDRRGGMVMFDGNHRLAIIKALGTIPMVPVEVRFHEGPSFPGRLTYPGTE